MDNEDWMVVMGMIVVSIEKLWHDWDRPQSCPPFLILTVIFDNINVETSPLQNTKVLLFSTQGVR
jgi:hypothetical protein